QRINLLQRFVGLPHICQLGCVNHLQAPVVGQPLNRLFGGVCGLLPLLGFAIGVDNLLIASFGVVVPENQHLAEGFQRHLIVVVLAIDGSQALQEHGPVVFFRLGVATVCFFGLLEQT